MPRSGAGFENYCPKGTTGAVQVRYALFDGQEEKFDLKQAAGLVSPPLDLLSSCLHVYTSAVFFNCLSSNSVFRSFLPLLTALGMCGSMTKPASFGSPSTR